MNAETNNDAVTHSTDTRTVCLCGVSYMTSHTQGHMGFGAALGKHPVSVLIHNWGGHVMHSPSFLLAVSLLLSPVKRLSSLCMSCFLFPLSSLLFLLYLSSPSSPLLSLSVASLLPRFPPLHIFLHSLSLSTSHRLQAVKAEQLQPEELFKFARQTYERAMS